jgi:hypothetical protein
MERRFSVTGRITFISPMPHGLRIGIAEQGPSELAEVTYHTLVVWNPMAAILKSKLRKGWRVEWHGLIEIREKNNKTYLNYIIQTWRRRPTPWRPKRPVEPRDDDWFVPEPNDRDSRTTRLAEGFSI